MKRRKWLILATLLLMSALLLTAGPVAAGGRRPVTRFTGVAVDTQPVLPGPHYHETPLPGGRLLAEGLTLAARRYDATDDRIDGEGSLDINGILQPSGTIKCWGEAEIVVDGGGTWEGTWHGTHTPSFDGTFRFEYTGSDGLEGLRMKMTMKMRGESMTISGFISEVPSH